MPARNLLTLTAVLLLAAAPSPTTGQSLPPAFRGLKPYEVVTQIVAQREALDLTEAQVIRLDSLRLAVRTEKHRFTHRGGKPHRTRHVTMISRGQAFKQAMSVLTPEQQERVERLFQTTPVPSPGQGGRASRPGKR